MAAILFGIAAVFLLLQMRLYKSNATMKAICIGLLTISFYFIIVLKSRIVWIGIVLVIAAIKIATKQWRLNKVLSAILILLFAACVGIGLFYKTDSTLGRLFIYKIDLLIIGNNWFAGIHQPFNTVYNHTQAEWFSSNMHHNSKEVLLASNGFFVFNEWLHAFILFGILGFITAILATAFFIKECFRQLRTNANKSPFIGVAFFILVTAMVSYPFSFGIYTCIFLCCLLYIISDASWYPFKKNKRFITSCLYVSIITFFTIRGVKDFLIEKDIEKLKQQFGNGRIDEALQQALSLGNTVTDNGQLYELIGKIYLQKNNTDAAIHYIEKAHHWLCTDELHCLWGNCLTEQNKLYEAGSHYQMAVNIVPCRFRNRMLLLNNLISLQERDKALACAKTMMDLPEKIPSAQTATYKQHAGKLYLDLKSTP